MKLLGLPGRKQSTFPSMAALVRAVRLGQTATHVRRYSFWGEQDAPAPALDAEVAHAAASGADLVIAKSIGTLVTMLASDRHAFGPRGCVFIGTPVRRLEAMDALGLLQGHVANHPTLLIQQTSDFNGPYASLSGMALHERSRLVEIPGDDHLYADTRLLAGVIEAWAGDQL